MGLVALFQVGPDDFDQLLGGITTRGPGVSLGKDVNADMTLKDFSHQAVHCAAACGDQAQDVTALDLLLQGALERLDLTADPADTVEQLRPFPEATER